MPGDVLVTEHIEHIDGDIDAFGQGLRPIFTARLAGKHAQPLVAQLAIVVDVTVGRHQHALPVQHERRAEVHAIRPCPVRQHPRWPGLPRRQRATPVASQRPAAGLRPGALRAVAPVCCASPPDVVRWLQHLAAMAQGPPRRSASPCSNRATTDSAGAGIGIVKSASCGAASPRPSQITI